MNRTGALLLTCLFLCCNPAPGQAAAPVFSHAVAGSPFDYTVQKGDFLISIGARFGESAEEIARDSGIRYDALLHPGQSLRIDNRHIVPEVLEDGILINLPQRMLFYFRGGVAEEAFPVGLGRPSWATPTADFHVVEMRRHPTWVVPLSIQEEMRLKGKEVQTRVPPGKDNPLGDYWIGLSVPGYGIHATNAPPSIYQFQSHGCIRLHPDDAEKLFSEVSVGTSGKIIYAPLLLAALDDGRIFLEVQPDIYNKGGDALNLVTELAAANHLTNRIDWQKAANVVEQQEGLARQVNLPDVGQ